MKAKKKPPPAYPRLVHATDPAPYVREPWHRGADVEIYFYARSLQRAAQLIVQNLPPEPGPAHVWDATPVILLYRQTVELYLKFLVEEGSDVVEAPDHITLYKTRSLRWLAQIVCQIIKALSWEDEFKCLGISSLADFNAAVAQLEELEPVTHTIRAGPSATPGEVPVALEQARILELVPRWEALANLLSATGDALTATWDLLDSGENPTIH